MPRQINVSDVLLIDVAKIYTGGFYYFNQGRMVEEFGLLVSIYNAAGRVRVYVELEVQDD